MYWETLVLIRHMLTYLLQMLLEGISVIISPIVFSDICFAEVCVLPLSSVPTHPQYPMIFQLLLQFSRPCFLCLLWINLNYLKIIIIFTKVDSKALIQKLMYYYSYSWYHFTNNKAIQFELNKVYSFDNKTAYIKCNETWKIVSADT